MTVITRNFSASPQRTASEVWTVIIETIAANNEKIQNTLKTISGIASSIIADETPESDAITVIGSGPRLRIYCIYGENAISGENSESVLSWNIFESEWQIYFPVRKEDLEWTSRELKQKGANFFAYEVGQKIDTANESVDSKTSQLTINIAKLKEING